MNMNVMLVRNTYSPKLRLLPSLVFTIRSSHLVPYHNAAEREHEHPIPEAPPRRTPPENAHLGCVQFSEIFLRHKIFVNKT